MKYSIINFIPKKIGTRKILLEIKPNSVIVYCKGRRPPKVIEVPKYIDLNGFFVETIGLYFGDGINKSNRIVGLTNTNFVLHKHFLAFLESFGINKNDLHVQIQIGSKYRLSKNNLINYWSRKLALPPRVFCKNINLRDLNCKLYGLSSVNYYSTLFRSIFDNLFKFSLGLCLKNKDLAIAFINGIFAAEGSVILSKRGAVSCLDIPIKDSKRRRFVKNLFDSAGIRTKDTGLRLLVTGYLNFDKFRVYDLAKMHPDKFEKFNLGFKKLVDGEPKALTKLRIINSLKVSPATRFEIASANDISNSVVHKALRDLEIKGIVERIGKMASKHKHVDVWGLKEKTIDPWLLIRRDY